MEAHQKAWDLIEKMNGQPIDVETWGKASDYAKNDLKRKANVVIDEIVSLEIAITEVLNDDDDRLRSEKFLAYWNEVRGFIGTM